MASLGEIGWTRHAVLGIESIVLLFSPRKTRFVICANDATMRPCGVDSRCRVRVRLDGHAKASRVDSRQVALAALENRFFFVDPLRSTREPADQLKPVAPGEAVLELQRARMEMAARAEEEGAGAAVSTYAATLMGYLRRARQLEKAGFSLSDIRRRIMKPEEAAPSKRVRC